MSLLAMGSAIEVCCLGGLDLGAQENLVFELSRNTPPMNVLGSFLGRLSLDNFISDAISRAIGRDVDFRTEFAIPHKTLVLAAG